MIFLQSHLVLYHILDNKDKFTPSQKGPSRNTKTWAPVLLFLLKALFCSVIPHNSGCDEDHKLSLPLDGLLTLEEATYNGQIS